ncbi:MAG: sugar nucleotide-binding protein, partial [Pseudomonadales bacterium]|nr:sugar nucleotide-binding protein [Pseudomonadales bacterium]
MPEPTDKPQLLWLGFGDLAQAARPHLDAAGYTLVAARRNCSQLPASLPALAMDVTRPVTLRALQALAPHAVIITLTAAANEAAYRAVYVDGLANVIAALEASGTSPLLLFASSTSVYAQNDGSRVDELSATLPAGYSGRCMLEAEALLQCSSLPACAIRFSGIYGGQRNNHLLRVLQQGRVCPAVPAKYSNRIHVEDCARIFVHLLNRYYAGQPLAPVYLACDNHPAPLRDVMLWLAA